MALTFKITGNTTNIMPWDTLHGKILAFNQITAEYSWKGNDGYIGTADEFTFDTYCGASIVATNTETITVNGFCNTEFDIEATKSNCSSGTPTKIIYTVDANTICNQTSVEKANWLAYLQALPLAQAEANSTGDCIDCTVVPESTTPILVTTCVELSSPFIQGTATPSAVLKLYNQNLVELETFTVPLNGIFNLNIIAYYNDNEAFILTAKDGIKEVSDFSRFVIKCENVYKKKSKKYKHCC